MEGVCVVDYISAGERGGDYILEGARCFDLKTIFECGQAFRWESIAPDTYQGVVGGRCRQITQSGETLILRGVDEHEFNSVWFDYFDLGRDYGALQAVFSCHKHLREAVQYCPGIRVLRQEGWEALCTFILSQNNNISRIKGLVKRLCEHFGETIDGGFAFPTPQRLAPLSPGDLAVVRCGFRAKYIIAAARAVADGQINFEALRTLPVEQAMSILQTIYGVGPKVAHCALLFGFGRVECLPVDVWMRRALQAWFPDGLPGELRPVAGIAQQYIFHYARTGKSL